MKKHLKGMALTVIASAIAQIGYSADNAETQKQASPGQADAIGEIVVTATRRAQRIQDVPMNVIAITSEELVNNNILKFDELAKLSPGLDLATNSNGPAASLRGVSTVTTTGGPPAVDVYFNESSLNGVIAFRSIYDIGQVEVLHGPQGTLRGDTAPTGAITIATKRPVFNEVGGMASLSVSKREQWGQNISAAVNVPVIDDKLAFRVAGLFDTNDANGASNPTTGAKSKQETNSFRASVLWRPAEKLEIFGMYQNLTDRSRDLARVEGAGLGFNGPVLGKNDNRAVQELTDNKKFTAEIGSLIARLDLGSATLNYVGGYRKQDSKQGNGDLERDYGNSILNSGRWPGYNSIVITQWTHELRLDSAGANRFWDYTAGLYQANNGSRVHQITPQVGLPGAFGLPARTPPSGPIDFRYVSNLNLHLYGGDDSTFGDTGSKSIFASSTFNFDSKTHVRVGARKIFFSADNNFVLGLDPAFIAAGVPFPTSLCSTFIPGSITSPNYSTACDIPFGPLALSDQHAKRKFQAWIYDVNVRQEITNDAMVYGSIGRNWRAPGLSQGNVPAQYFLANPETSRNLEIGMKAKLFNRRARFTAAVFQQDFKNYNASVSQIPFRDPSSATGVTDAFGINYNGDAQVRGFESTIFGQLTDQWTAGAAVGYSKSKFKNAISPCRDANFDGVPDSGTPTAAAFDARGVITATCPNSGPINGMPEWSYSVQTEYTMPLSGNKEAYVRALYNSKGKGLIMSSSEPIKQYGILDLYAGVRISNSSLDIGFYAKNLLNTERKIDQSGLLSSLGRPSGYRQVYYTPGRELGVSARWSFGGG